MTGRFGGALRGWPWHLLVVAVAAVFVQLGLWQLDRHGQLQARNALIEERLGVEAQPYALLRDRLDPDAPAGDGADARYRPVTATGRFDPEHEVLLRGHAHRDRPGHHLLTPMVLPDGGALLVNRGWVPYRLDEPPIEEAAPLVPTTTVEGHLMPEEDPPTGAGALLAPRDPPEGPLSQTAYADVERLQAQMPYPLEPFVLRAEGPVPDNEAGLPVPHEPPAPSSGPHLSYAAQWFFFAGVAVVGYLLLLRARARAGPSDASDASEG